MTAQQEIKIIQIQPEHVPIAQKVIFRPFDKESKFDAWWRNKLFNWATYSTPQMKRYKRVHHWAKRHVFQKGLKVLRRVLGKYMIKSLDDIPQEWFNNHHRIFYYSFQKGLEDSFTKMFFPYQPPMFREQKFGNDAQKFWREWVVDKKYWSWENRRDIIRLWMTEILEDTFDREWINFSMMRMVHEMMEWYGVSEEERKKVPVSGEYPMYLSRTQNDPHYQMQSLNERWGRIWKPKEEIYDGKKIEDKESDKGKEQGNGSEGKDGKVCEESTGS